MEKIKERFLDKTKDMLDEFILKIISDKEHHINLLKAENIKLKEEIKTLENKILVLEALGDNNKATIEIDVKEEIKCEEKMKAQHIQKPKDLSKKNKKNINDKNEVYRQLSFDGLGGCISSKGIISRGSGFRIKTIKASLKEESALASLGYSTTKSKRIRWDILQNVAIPQLGLEKTKSIIRRFINYNGKSSRQKRALEEWKFDLDRLNKL